MQPTFAQSSAVPGTRARKPSLDDMGPGTDRPEPQRDADAVSRIRKPSLDEMGSARNRPVPARAPEIDPRTKAGAYGEQVKGPHKPTLDEMGPHAERGLPISNKPLPRKPTGSPPHHAEGVSSTRGGEGLGVGGNTGASVGQRPTRTIDVPTDAEKKARRGRPRKTGRPGQ